MFDPFDFIFFNSIGGDIHFYDAYLIYVLFQDLAETINDTSFIILVLHFIC